MALLVASSHVNGTVLTTKKHQVARKGLMLAELAGHHLGNNLPDSYMNFVEDMANKRDLANSDLKPNQESD